MQVGDELELDLDPVAPLAGLEQQLLIANHELGAADVRVDVDREFAHELFGLDQQRVRWAVQGTLEDTVDDVGRVDLAARDVAVELGTIGGEEVELTRGAAEVGRAHTGKLVGADSDRREVGRHTNHRALEAVFFELLPERVAVSGELDAAAGQGQPPLADVDRAADRDLLARGLIRRSEREG